MAVESYASPQRHNHCWPRSRNIRTRPPQLKAMFMKLFSLQVYPKYFLSILEHSIGRMSADEKRYIPESDFTTIYWKARIYVALYAIVIGFAVYERSVLPLMFVGLTNLFGGWLMPIYGLTQHAGLAENVLDHRLNCRTVYMNPDQPRTCTGI